MMASAHNAYVVAQDSNPDMVQSEWPNFQDFLEEIALSLIGESRTKRDPVANPRPAPHGAGKHDVRKLYDRKKSVLSVRWQQNLVNDVGRPNTDVCSVSSLCIWNVSVHIFTGYLACEAGNVLPWLSSVADVCSTHWIHVWNKLNITYTVHVV